AGARGDGRGGAGRGGGDECERGARGVGPGGESLPAVVSQWGEQRVGVVQAGSCRQMTGIGALDVVTDVGEGDRTPTAAVHARGEVSAEDRRVHLEELPGVRGVAKERAAVARPRRSLP